MVADQFLRYAFRETRWFVIEASHHYYYFYDGTSSVSRKKESPSQRLQLPVLKIKYQYSKKRKTNKNKKITSQFLWTLHQLLPTRQAIFFIITKYKYGSSTRRAISNRADDDRDEAQERKEKKTKKKNAAFFFILKRNGKDQTKYNKTARTTRLKSSDIICRTGMAWHAQKKDRDAFPSYGIGSISNQVTLRRCRLKK